MSIATQQPCLDEFVPEELAGRLFLRRRAENKAFVTILERVPSDVSRIVIVAIVMVCRDNCHADNSLMPWGGLLVAGR
jgi:hypothetical protein